MTNYCKDCAHYEKAVPRVPLPALCIRRKTSVDLVTGRKRSFATLAHAERREAGWWSWLRRLDRCGPDAKFFVAKTQIANDKYNKANQ